MEDKETASKLKGHTIYVIPYCHCDWAWTYSREWHEERYCLSFNEALDILRTNPDYRWYIDSWSEMFSPFLKMHSNRVEELRKRVVEGKIAITGGVTIARPDQIGQESFVRNVVMGRRLFEKEFPGADFSVLTLNDITPGTAQMPQLIAKLGYKYYRFYRPLGAFDQKNIPSEFYWEGLDGTKIICSRGEYGGIYRPGKSIEECLKDEVVARMKFSAVPLLWWSMGADDIRPLRDYQENPVDMVGFIKEWNSKHPDTPMRFATPVEFFKDIEKAKDKLSTLSGVLDPVGWSYWYGQIGNESLRVWRVKADDVLVRAEGFLSVSESLGSSYPDSEMEALWYRLLQTSAHATIWLFEEDYREILRWAKSVYYRGREILTSTLEDIMLRVKVKKGSDSVVVFNPSSWDRKDVVKMHKVFPMRGTRSLTVKDNQGKALPHQVVDPEPYENGTFKEIDLIFLAEVPAMGYATFYIEKHPDPPSQAEPRSDGKTIENDYFRLSFRENLLQSIYDKQNGVEYDNANDLRYYVIKDTGPYHYGPVIDVKEMVGSELKVTASGPIMTRVSITGRVGDHGVEEEITLYNYIDRIDFKTTIDSKGGDGFFRVNFSLGYDGEIYGDAPFGVEERDVRKEPYGSLERRREDVFYVSHWADYTDGKKGLTVVGAPGVQGFAFDPKTRTLGHTILKTITHPTQGWERFETKLREGKGKQTFEYSLIPHGGDWRDARIYRRAIERRHPLIPVKVYEGVEERQLPEAKSFLRVAPDNVLLSGFYKDWGDFLVRVYETAGQGCEANISLPFAAKSVREVDLTGNELPKRINHEGDRISFSIKPWEIVTFRVVK